jgi:tripartite-type tricarboxylate transporter receptor subunit TctC
MIARRALFPLLLLPAGVRAQGAWPSQPLRFVVPFAPGGSSDIIMRLLAPRMSAALGQPIVIENRPGAGSTVGTDAVAKARDGHSFVHATLSGIGIAPALYPRLPYDPLQDLVAIAPTALVPFALTVTTRGWDIRSAAQLIETLRAAPGRHQYGSPGIGSTGHLANANFATRIGAEVEHVPYRAGAQSTAALLAGEVHFTHEVYGIMAPHHRAGRARCLFVTADERTPLLPDVPTMAEAGVPHYRAYSWFGMFGPATTPAEHVQRIAAAVAAAMSERDVAARLEELGTPALPRWTPARFAEFVAEEVREWGPLVRASGARVE